MFDGEYDDEELKEEDNDEIDLRDNKLDGQDITEEEVLGMGKNRKLIFNIFIGFARSS